MDRSGRDERNATTAMPMTLMAAHELAWSYGVATVRSGKAWKPATMATITLPMHASIASMPAAVTVTSRPMSKPATTVKPTTTTRQMPAVPTVLQLPVVTV